MPLIKQDGKPGLLMHGTFGETVNTKLPLYDVNDIGEGTLLTALFRDYTFLASAYLLEPCDLLYRKTKEYGLGRSFLPKEIAVPLAIVAKKIQAKPFMEYAQSYALFNYRKIDETQGLKYDNLALIRKFSGCKSEHGFILVHVAMVAHSGNLVKQVMSALDACEVNNRLRFENALSEICHVTKEINRVMDTMWGRSLPQDYNSFRTFIMGTKNQPMFPNGVIYKGVYDKPVFFRGESGANDSIIPTLDNFLQLTQRMPLNPLTEILKDFRTYRPVNHNEWLNQLQERSTQAQIKKFALSSPSTTILYLQILDQVRDFRSRHWNFTKQYILKYSDHPVATGGSPIVTWLPNQLFAVLNSMINDCQVNTLYLDAIEKQIYDQVMHKAQTQKKILDKDVNDLAIKFGRKGVEASIN